MVLSEYVSVGQSSTYYEKDNYYQVQIGEYRGKLKDELKLGDLDHASFQNLIRGINPITGEPLVASKSGQNKQRAAIDICMKAPKSYSVLVELAAAKGEKELYNSLMSVWDKSVNTTLDHIEKEYSYTRVQKNKKRENVKTGNFLITKFQHDTARPVTNKKTKIVNIDPDVHTHCLIMNITKGPDGKYRSVEAKKLLNSNLINGQFLRSELAANLQKYMNINIEVTDHKQGLIEIEGMPKPLLEECSSRHKQIQEKLVELREKFPNINETKLQKMAAKASRESKKIIDIDRKEIRQNNLQRAERLIDVDELLLKFKQAAQQAQKEKKFENTKNQIEEVQTTHIVHTVKNSEAAVKKLPKYKQNIYSVLGNSTVALLGQVRASEIFSHVKKSQEDRQQVFNTMHEVLIKSLKSTKLDTEKLFSSLKHIDKHHIEEVLENGKTRTPGERDRFITSYRELADKLERAKQSHYRDVADLATTTAERRGIARAELERDDAAHARTTAKDNRPAVVTAYDLRRAEDAYRRDVERERREQERGGVER